MVALWRRCLHPPCEKPLWFLHIQPPRALSPRPFGWHGPPDTLLFVGQQLLQRVGITSPTDSHVPPFSRCSGGTTDAPSTSPSACSFFNTPLQVSPNNRVLPLSLVHHFCVFYLLEAPALCITHPLLPLPLPTGLGLVAPTQQPRANCSPWSKALLKGDRQGHL